MSLSDFVMQCIKGLSMHSGIAWYHPLRLSDIWPQVTYRSEKMFHTNMQKNASILFLGSILFIMNIWNTQKYIFSESSQSKDSTGIVSKPNNTGWENYTGWNIKIIMHFRQPQHPLLSIIISMESKEKISLSKEHYFGLPNQEEIHLPYFRGKTIGW